MYQALPAASVAMANTGKMRGSAAESSKKTSVSKLLLKPTRLPKTALSCGVKGRDNLGFVPGPVGSEAEMDKTSPGTAIIRPWASTTENGSSQCRDDAIEKPGLEQISKSCGPRTKQSPALRGERQSSVDEEKRIIRRCDEMARESTFTRIPEEGAYPAGAIGAVRTEVLAHTSPLSKYGSTTALETLSSRRSESPIYEELDFRCASFRDLNCDPSRRLESPNVSDSSAELSNSRRALPYLVRHLEHRGQYSSPSCGVRIAEMRATRKYDGLRISPSSLTTKPGMQHKGIAAGSDRRRSQSSGKGSPAPNEASERSSSTQVPEKEKHRSSLDLNVTYVEYFDETRAPCSSQTTSVCAPVATSYNSSVSSLAESKRISSPSPTNFPKGHRRTATSGSLGAERDFQAANIRRPPKFAETSRQREDLAKEEKRQMRPTGFTGSEIRFAKSSTARKPWEADKIQELRTALQPGSFSEPQGRVTGITVAESSSRPESVRRSISEPESTFDGSASVLSSPNSTDTLIDSVRSETSLTEDTANDNLASSETTEDDDNSHSTHAERPLLDIRAPRKILPSSARLPSHLRGPTTHHQSDPSQHQSAAKTTKFSGRTLTSSASCLVPKQRTAKQQNAPAALLTSPTKSIIQRLDNFDQSAESKAKVGVTQPIKLSKSTSSTDLHRNISHLQTSVCRTNKSIGNTTGVSNDCISTPKTQNSRLKIPPSRTPIRTSVRPVQNSDARPAPVSNHSSTACISSTSSKPSAKSGTAVKRDSGWASVRSEDPSHIARCQKDSSSSTASTRFTPSTASASVSNKFLRHHTVPSSEGSGKHPCSRLLSPSDNATTPFSMQQQLSPIAERSPRPHSSTSSGESIFSSVSKNSRGQVSPQVLPFSRAKSSATQFCRSLSSSQRTLSMSKISSAKPASPVTSGTPTKPDMQGPVSRFGSDSSSKLVSEDCISKMSQMSKSHSNILECSSAAQENSPSALLHRTIGGGRRLDTASCTALNICPESQKSLQSNVSGSASSRQSIKTNADGLRLEVDANPSTLTSEAAKTPDNATPDVPKKPRSNPIRAEKTQEVKQNSLAEPTKSVFSSRLRTPTDFNSCKRSEKNNDREISLSVCGNLRTSSSQTASDENEESESVVTPTSVFKQLQLKHVKPYTSASNRGASIAEKFNRSRSSVEGGNVRHNVAANIDKSSGANFYDLKTSSNFGLSLAMPSLAPSMQSTESDAYLVTKSIQEEENQLEDSDNLVHSSESSNLDSSPEAAVNAERSLCSSQRKACHRQEDAWSSCSSPESSSPTHLVSSFECAETLPITSSALEIDYYSRTVAAFDENEDKDPLSKPSENTIGASQEIDGTTIPFTYTLGDHHTDHALGTKTPIPEPKPTDIPVPDPRRLSATTRNSDVMQNNATLTSKIQPGNSQTARSELGIDAELAERFDTYTELSLQCISSDTDYGSVPLSRNELFSETTSFSSPKKSSDCRAAVDFSEKTLQGKNEGISDSDQNNAGISNSLQVEQCTGAETLTEKDCSHHTFAAEVSEGFSSDVHIRRRTENGSQTMLSDIGCLVDSILLKPRNRNSLLLQNKIIVDQDAPLRDIEKFVVTYESANIIVLERADSISCPVSFDLKDELFDRPSRPDLAVSPTSSDIARKWGKDSLNSSRSVDLRTVTSPKGEPGNIPLSESGYDSWKSQSSKSSTRFLKLSDSEACAVSCASNLSETVSRRSGVESTYDKRSKDSELRRSGIQQSVGASAGYPDENLSSCRPVESNCAIGVDGITVAGRTYGSVEEILKFDSSSSVSDEKLRQEKDNYGNIRRLDLPDFSDISNADREDDVSCNYFQDDDDASLAMQASAVEDCFRGVGGSGEGFSSNFSSFPSSSSSLMDTLESISLDRSESHEGFAQLLTATTAEGTSNQLCVFSTEEKPAWDADKDLSDQPADLVDFAFGSCYELNSNAAAFLSRDYHNRIYKLDFGAGDSGDLAVDPEELDIGVEQGDLLSHSWVEEGSLQSTGKKSELLGNSAGENNQLQSLKYCGNSNSGPLRPSSVDICDQFSKQSMKSDDIHSYTFPLAIGKVLAKGGMREQEEARAVAEKCQQFSKSRRKHEKDTFYENVCDELLESLEANLSDSDNTPSPTAQDLQVNSDERIAMCFGENYSIRASTSPEFQNQLSRNNISSEEGNVVLPVSSGNSTLGAKGQQTHCGIVNKSNTDATHLQMIESYRENSVNAKSCEVTKPASDKTNCKLPSTSTEETSRDSAPPAAVVWERPFGVDCHLHGSEEGKQTPRDGSLNVLKELFWVSQYCIEEPTPEDVGTRVSITVCKETASDAKQACPSIRKIADGNLEGDSNQIPTASCLVTLPLAESEVVIRSNDHSPSDTGSKEEVKSGSSAGLLTRYFPGLLRRQAKDRHTNQEITERKGGRKLEEKSTMSRNSAPVSYDRESKNITEQEPRSVRDVIRKFEDKTAAQTAASLSEGSRSSTALEKSSSEEQKGSSGKRSKFSKKTKS